MKNLNFIMAIMIFALTLMVTLSTPVMAKDVLLDVQIESAVTALDKNGNEYTRFIIKESREISGVKYEADTTVMAFGSTVEAAKKLTAGDRLKVVAKEKEYRGDTNYTIMAFVK